jgi:hypothetical protein
MSPHVVVLPASTQAGRATIIELLKNQALVTGVYRDLSKVDAGFASNPNFTAVQGDVSTGIGLDLSNADAVFHVPPPIYDGTRTEDFATNCANNVSTDWNWGPILIETFADLSTVRFGRLKQHFRNQHVCKGWFSSQRLEPIIPLESYVNLTKLAGSC